MARTRIIHGELLHMAKGAGDVAQSSGSGAS